MSYTVLTVAGISTPSIQTVQDTSKQSVIIAKQSQYSTSVTFVGIRDHLMGLTQKDSVNTGVNHN